MAHYLWIHPLESLPSQCYHSDLCSALESTVHPQLKAHTDKAHARPQKTGVVIDKVNRLEYPTYILNSQFSILNSSMIHSYTGGHVFTNGYVVEHNGTCIVFDAPALIHEVIQDKGLKPTHLLLTHQHFDHTEDVEALQNMGVKVLMHSTYAETLIRQKEARQNWGIPVEITPFSADQLLEGESSIQIGDLEIQISHVPGHSPDSITYYIPELEVVFVGDTLMEGSMGRTDLPGGSHETLISGIREKLYTLPDATTVCAGHGSVTSIGNEKANNPFI